MGQMDMVVLRINNSLSDKVIPILPSINMRGCMTLGHKGKVVSPEGQFILGMVICTRVGVCLVKMDVMDMVRVAI